VNFGSSLLKFSRYIFCSTYWVIKYLICILSCVYSIILYYHNLKKKKNIVEIQYTKKNLLINRFLFGPQTQILGSATSYPCQDADYRVAVWRTLRELRRVCKCNCIFPFLPCAFNGPVQSVKPQASMGNLCLFQ
jgi:hypothetical protein